MKYRLEKHKNKSFEAPNRKIYKCILGNGGFKEWKMEALETFETENATERFTREQHYINELKPDLNSVLAINIG